jgi:hypothetical protein
MFRFRLPRAPTRERVQEDVPVKEKSKNVFQTRLSCVLRNGCSQIQGGVMFKSLSLTLFVLISLILAAAVPASAQHGGHGGGATHEMNMPTQDVLVEGTVVSFAVMENSNHRKMLKNMKMKDDIEPGTTHNIMITLKDQATQKPITDASLGLRVVDPSGKDQIKTMKFESSMNSYDAYFNMPDKGKYQLLVLVRKGDQKMTAGIYHDVP